MAISLNDLLEAGVHFGHQSKRWNPKMKPYIYGSRNGISIFDLTITIRHLGHACEFVRDLVAGGGTVLLVGSKRQAQEVLREAAGKVGMPFMCSRWLGGALTNFGVIHKRIQYLRNLRQKEQDGGLEKHPKKEQAKIRKELAKLNETLGGVIDLDRLPDALIVVDVMHEAIAVKEANRLNIPVVAIVDSNCNPDGITEVIPGNDDALRSIQALVNALAAAIAEGNIQYGKKNEVEALEEAKAEKVEAEAEADAARDGETVPAAQ